MTFFTGSASRKISRNSSKRVFEPFPSLIPPQVTRPHAHTPIPGTTDQYHTTAPTLARLISLQLLLAASYPWAFFAPLASSVYHTMAPACVIDVILPTAATPAIMALAALGRLQRHERSFGGFRLSPTPPTRMVGSSRAKHALLAENAQSTESFQTIFGKFCDSGAYY